ncbi:MAG: PilZ domain-containing protein [Treponema sp.]|jgi:hypothetical protein|nr:PilZ domain-containing protein [Treponema sp.]
MKLLLIAAGDEIREALSRIAEPLGLALIHYRHILKAMDNLDELSPQAVLISTRDFPRHWKPLVQFAKTNVAGQTSSVGPTGCAVLLLRGEDFPPEEAQKACFLGVSGIAADSLDRPEDASRLRALLVEALGLKGGPAAPARRLVPRDRSGLCLVHPESKALVLARVKAVSATGLSFETTAPNLIERISAGTILSECSLRLGERILSPICRRGRERSLDFVYLEAGEEQYLDGWLRAH